MGIRWVDNSLLNLQVLINRIIQLMVLSIEDNSQQAFLLINDDQYEYE
jgi:hypothetical protein